MLFSGIKLSRPHVMNLAKIIFMMLLLFANYFFVLSNCLHLFIYFVSLSCGTGLGIWMTYKVPLKTSKNENRFEIPGSYFPLMFFMSFFILKCIFGYGHATNSKIFNQYLWLETLINGVFSGYLLGWLVYLLYFIRKRNRCSI